MRVSIRLLGLLVLWLTPTLGSTWYHVCTLRATRLAELERSAAAQANLVAALLPTITQSTRPKVVDGQPVATGPLTLTPRGAAWLDQILAPHSRLLITDPRGQIVLTHPARDPQLRDLEQTTGLRTVGFVPVAQSPQRLLMTIAIDPAAALASLGPNTARLWGLTLATLSLSLLTAWAAAHWMLVRPLIRLRSALQDSQQDALRDRIGRMERVLMGPDLNALLDQCQALSVRTQMLQHARDAALAASAAKTRFMAAASHDLRQPLHALSLTVAALAHRPLPGDVHIQTLIQRLRRGVATLTELVEALLDLARLDTGQIKPVWATVALNPLLHGVAEEFRPLAEAQGVTLVVADCPFAAHTDRALLRTMVRNIVANAIKFTPAGGRVDMYAYASKAGLAMIIRDTGIGIAPERHHEIFEEFRQLDTPHRQAGQGLGLGLHIVKRLADLLQHTIELDSRPGAGATFILRLGSALPAQ